MTQFNEFSTQIHGIVFLANNYDHSSFCCKLNEEYMAACKLANKSLEDSPLLGPLRVGQRAMLQGTCQAIGQMKAAMAQAKPSQIKSRCDKLPALMCVGGSAFPTLIIDEETLTSIFLGGSNLGGKSFLGLSHLLLGTKVSIRMYVHVRQLFA
jgi:hypothetical protein